MGRRMNISKSKIAGIITVAVVLSCMAAYLLYTQPQETGLRGTLKPTVVLEYPDGTSEEIDTTMFVPLKLVYSGRTINAIYVKWTVHAAVDSQSGTIDYAYTVGVKYGSTVIDSVSYSAIDKGVALGTRELGGICSSTESEISAKLSSGTYTLTHYIDGSATAHAGGDTYTGSFSGSYGTSITLTTYALTVIVTPGTPQTW